MKPLTIVVTASGAPGTAALLHALRENGEREVRLVGTDMSERSVGRHLCDAFYLVPAGSDPGFAEAIRAIAEKEGAAVVLPQSSFDLEGLAGKRFEGVAVLVSPPGAIKRSNDKAESYAFLRSLGLPAPDFRRVQGAAEVEAAARELGYPERPVCFKPVFSSGSRGFRILDPTVDRADQLLRERPGSVSMLLEDAVEILASVDDRTELLVMELATGRERTIDGIANGREIVLGHPKTREGMRAGLAMYFVTLADEGLMALSNEIVAELGIEHFFNIQLVGEQVIEINPRISTIVYQEDLNLPYLGVKRAIGEISDDELRALAPRIRPGRTALRFFDQLEWDA
jgi:carbamoyl-phosphate synthase large subunit